MTESDLRRTMRINHQPMPVLFVGGAGQLTELRDGRAVITIRGGPHDGDQMQAELDRLYELAEGVLQLQTN